MRLKSVFRIVPVAAVLFGVAMFSSPRAVLASTPREQIMEKAVTTELKELRSLMSQLSLDADQLNPLTASGQHWETHAIHLNRIKADINRVGEKLDWLQTIRFTAAPWQQEVIDAVGPVAVQVADRTSTAIEHLNSGHQHLWAPHYVDHLRSISSLSDQMRGLVDNHLKIVEAQERLANIQGELAERIS